jgi:hypothetical protein
LHDGPLPTISTTVGWCRCAGRRRGGRLDLRQVNVHVDVARPASTAKIDYTGKKQNDHQCDDRDDNCGCSASTTSAVYDCRSVSHDLLLHANDPFAANNVTVSREFRSSDFIQLLLEFRFGRSSKRRARRPQ